MLQQTYSLIARDLIFLDRDIVCMCGCVHVWMCSHGYGWGEECVHGCMWM